MPRPAKYVPLPAPAPGLGSDEMRSEVGLDFAAGTAFVNQGGFGVCPKRVVAFRHALFEEMESNPDLWFRSLVRGKYDRALEAAAGHLGSDPRNLVFVTNVTTGLNAAFNAAAGFVRERLAGAKRGGSVKVLRTSLTYNATNFMVEHLAETTGAGVVTLDVRFPIGSEEDAVEMFRKACQQDPDIEVVVLDHISSSSAVLWPLEKIARALKATGTVRRIIVDGAHAPGQAAGPGLEELGRSGVDFYSGNLHKWALAPRGCAVLWCAPAHTKRRSGVLPANVSHEHYLGHRDRFFQQGTADYSNYLSVPAALAFATSLGGLPALQAHARGLLDWAQGELAGALGTAPLAVPKSMEAPFMRCVGLPDLPGRGAPNFDSSLALTEEVIKEYNVAVYISAFDGRFWVRLSAGIYNRREDYARLKEALADKVQKEIRRGGPGAVVLNGSAGGVGHKTERLVRYAWGLARP